MKKALLPLLFTLLAGFSAFAQQTSATNLTPENIKQLLDASVKYDQQRFKLTPEQTIQDRKVLRDYYASADGEKKNFASIEQLKASVRKKNVQLAAGYKSFLNAEQYNHFLTTYNKLHPNNQLH